MKRFDISAQRVEVYRTTHCSRVLVWLLPLLICPACSLNDEQAIAPNNAQLSAAETPPPIVAWRSVDELKGAVEATESQDFGLAQFQTVFWEAADTDSLRRWIVDQPNIAGSRVLEIGTGTGLISLLSVQQGAAKVVATDINPNALANAKYNSERLGLDAALELRKVPPDNPGPFVVIAGDERFEFIISNPPWEDGPITDLASHAFYDPNFALLDSLLETADRYLAPGGSLLLAYGAKTAVERILDRGPRLGWQVEVIDERELNTLPELFLPGMLLELRR